MRRPRRQPQQEATHPRGTRGGGAGRAQWHLEPLWIYTEVQAVVTSRLPLSPASRQQGPIRLQVLVKFPDKRSPLHRIGCGCGPKLLHREFET